MTNYAITLVVRARCCGPILGSTKTQTLVRDSRRILCNPTQIQIVDAPVLTHDPVYGPKAHNGFNIPSQRGAPPLPRLSVALSEPRTNIMQIVVFFPHSPVFLFSTYPSFNVSLFLISVSSLPPATFYSGILKAQTPAPVDVAVRPLRLVPWGHYSPFFFPHVLRTL